MRISIVQYDIAWEDKEANFERIERILAAGKTETDIIILPEMFTTGFSMRADHLAEAPGSLTSSWMSDLAQRFSAGVCGSYIVSDRGLFFNRWIFAGPAG